MKERSRNVAVDEGGGDRTEEAEKRRGGERKEERAEESMLCGSFNFQMRHTINRD